MILRRALGIARAVMHAYRLGVRHGRAMERAGMSRGSLAPAELRILDDLRREP